MSNGVDVAQSAVSMSSRFLTLWLLLLSGCGNYLPSVGKYDGGAVVGGDAGAADAGAGDAGTVDAGTVVKSDHSLFWTDAVLLDDPQVISFAKVMATIAADGHGGKLLDRWFRRFATTMHSERALPAQFLDGVVLAQGADPTQWAMGGLPFKVTGVHNRVDLADLTVGGHCGELRVSVASTDPTLQPFHMLFLFRQPAQADDADAAGVHCIGTARRWAELSLLEGAALQNAVKLRWIEGLTGARFLLAETVEETLSPWEWRQWVKSPDLDAGFVFENPPLFQQVDVDRLNDAGTLRDEFLVWVRDNAAALDARRVLFPEKFRAQSVRVPPAGVSRKPLSLAGLDGPVAAQFPQLRQEVELVGCAVCHTADADFVQTRPDRSVSKFYEKELIARERHLEKLLRGERPKPPFGPLQANPVLPP